MNILYFGFEDNGNENPIIIYILIQEPDYFKNNQTTALKVVKGIERIVYEELKGLEEYVLHLIIPFIYLPRHFAHFLLLAFRIYIDICQVHHSILRNANEVNDTAVNLAKKLNCANSELTPRPGSSIGRKNGNAAGSLSCFVKHKGDVYSLTCRHVVFTEEESPEAYRY